MSHSKMNEFWIVVPAFNEEKVVGSVISRLLDYFTNIVVVDDCSTDKTNGVSRDNGAIVIRHSVNLGQGAALQTGIDYALRMNANFIVTFDADGQHQVEDALKLVNAILSSDGGVDIVMGSRFLGIEPIGMPKAKRILLKLAVLFTLLTTGVRMTDAHNGLRVISSSAARKIQISQNGMAHASEIIHQIRRHKLNFSEIPVQVVYTQYSLSKGQRLSNSLKIVTDLALGRLSK